MIPAQFQAADDVFPQVILRGGSYGQRAIRVRINEGIGVRVEEAEELLLAAVSEVFTAKMEAEFLSGLIRGVTSHRPGFPVEVMDIQVVKGCAEPKSRHRRREGTPDIITGLIFSVAVGEAVDDTPVQCRTGQKRHTFGRRQGH